MRAGDASGISARVAPPPIKAQFDATKGTRRLLGWQPSGQNLNSLLTNGGDTLVRRARDLCRNNAYARAACDAFAANVVGAGIKPSSLLRSRPQREEIQRAWLEWTDAADADGLTDFYGLQALAARALFEAGECFIRIRERRPGDGLDVPIQLQMLEAEMCPWELNRQEPTGTAIRCGIEVNAIGRRVAYWFHRRHPGDSTEFIQSSAGDFYVRVPANQVIHLYNPLRPGQLRGVPWLTPSMIPLKILGDYDDAELERKRQAALIAGFITVPAPEYDPMNGEDQDDGTALAAIQPGMWQKLLPGEQVTLASPADVGNSYDPFQYRVLTQACAGLGMPYATVTGDLKQVNYSSIRAGLVEFRRRIEQLQHAVFVYQMCRPIWARFMDAAVLSGRLANLTGYARDPMKYRAVKWITPAWAWVDPLKDRKAEQLAVQMGWKSRSDVIEAEGYDPEEVDQRIKEDQERADALDLRLADGMQEDPADAALMQDDPVKEAA